MKFYASHHQWLIICSFLVFMMQVGFLCLEAGLTRPKNSISVALKNLLDFSLSILVFWAIGYAIAYSDLSNGFMPLSFEKAFFGQWDNDFISFFLYQSMFCGTCSTIISGSIAERAKTTGYIFSVVLVSSLIYPVVVHWSWNGFLLNEFTGFLGKMNFIDFAGSSVVHSTGGWVALAYMIILGPRLGRFDKKGEPLTIRGSDLPLATAGALLLWLGWFGFNTGTAFTDQTKIPEIFVTTALSGAAALVSAGMLSRFLNQGILKAEDLIMGLLTGLVAITACAHIVSNSSAVIIGMISGFIALAGKELLLNLKVDDPLGAVPVHLFGGIWGTLAAALFIDPSKSSIGIDPVNQILVQLLGIVVIGAWAFGVSFIILKIYHHFIGLKVSQEAEVLGLNATEHGVNNYVYDIIYAMERINVHGDYSKRVPVDPHMDTGAIAFYYNNLVDTVEKIQHSQSQSIEELTKMNEKLMSFDKALAHDLKNPMTLIKGYVEFLRSRVDGDDTEIKKGLDKIESATKKSTDIIQGLLDHVKDKDPSNSLEYINIDLVLEDVLEQFEKQVNEYDAEILTYLDDVNIFGHKLIITQAITNFVSNALKYRDPERPCKIEIKVYESDQNVVIDVVDNGQGIKTEDFDKVFKAFERVSDEKAEIEGHGVGLNNIKRLAESVGMKVSFESEYGKGSTFRINIVKEEAKNIPKSA